MKTTNRDAKNSFVSSLGLDDHWHRTHDTIQAKVLLRMERVNGYGHTNLSFLSSTILFQNKIKYSGS